MLFPLFVWMTFQRRCKWIIKIDILPKPASLWKQLCSKGLSFPMSSSCHSSRCHSYLSKILRTPLKVGTIYVYVCLWTTIMGPWKCYFSPEVLSCVYVCVLLKKLCNYVSPRKILFKMCLFSSPAENISGAGDRRVNLSVSEMVIRRWWEDWHFISWETVVRKSHPLSNLKCTHACRKLSKCRMSKRYF